MLKSWPDDYHLYEHNKGPASGNIRRDVYLIGEPTEYCIMGSLYLISVQRLNKCLPLSFASGVHSSRLLAHDRCRAKPVQLPLQILQQKNRNLNNDECCAGLPKQGILFLQNDRKRKER